MKKVSFFCPTFLGYPKARAAALREGTQRFRAEPGKQKLLGAGIIPKPMEMSGRKGKIYVNSGRMRLNRRRASGGTGTELNLRLILSDERTVMGWVVIRVS
jgi:hypothetical protein